MEIIRMLETERARRQGRQTTVTDLAAAKDIVKQFGKLQKRDTRPADDLLYDDRGMPK